MSEQGRLALAQPSPIAGREEIHPPFKHRGAYEVNLGLAVKPDYRSCSTTSAEETALTQPTKDLQTFANPAPKRDYEIRFDCPEFTCLCPLTSQPDFATMHIRYVPDALCVELKSLKLYLWSFRDERHFHEAVTNMILDQLVALLAPRSMTVEGWFNVRGGITTTIVASYEKEP